MGVVEGRRFCLLTGMMDVIIMKAGGGTGVIVVMVFDVDGAMFVKRICVAVVVVVVVVAARSD